MAKEIFIFFTAVYYAVEEMSRRELCPAALAYQRQVVVREVTQTILSYAKCEVGFCVCTHVLTITTHN
jgi:hypothetical protein